MNCGRSSSVEWKLPKLQRRVRFPSPAPPPGRAPGGFVMPPPCASGNSREVSLAPANMRLIGQVVLVFGLSFVATKPKGGGADQHQEQHTCAEAPCQSPSAQSRVHLAHNTPFSAFFAEVVCSLSTVSGAPTAKRGNYYHRPPTRRRHAGRDLLW